VCAAQHGLLLQLSWLHKGGCLWDERSSVATADGGHLDVLRWLRANGCPWLELTLSEAAARGGHVATQEWVHANRQTINIKTVTEDGGEIFFKCKMTTPMSKLMNAFCKRHGVATQSVRFFFRRPAHQTEPDTCGPRHGGGRLDRRLGRIRGQARHAALVFSVLDRRFRGGVRECLPGPCGLQLLLSAVPAGLLRQLLS